jgi:hypothetical protein
MIEETLLPKISISWHIQSLYKREFGEIFWEIHRCWDDILILEERIDKYTGKIKKKGEKNLFKVEKKRRKTEKKTVFSLCRRKFF